MKVVVEFNMVDMSMHKHETFFRHILKKYSAGIRGIKIIEPDEREIKKKICEGQVNVQKTL